LAPQRSFVGIEAVSLLAVILTAGLLFQWKPSHVFDNEQTFREAAENSLDDIYLFAGVTDATGKIVDFQFSYINPVAETRLRSPRETLLGRSLSEVRPFAVSSGLIAQYQNVVSTGVPYTCEVFVDDERITATWLHVHAVKVGNGLAITSRDVTERRRASDQASFLANHDPLTGLPNRMLLRSRLEAAVQHAQREHHKIAIFMIDVDNFKEINDSLGHMVGDQLLNIVAKRLSTTVRATDTVARLGGDEFIVVMPRFKTLADIERCGEKIVQNVSKQIMIDGQKINITVSVGFCIYPDSGRDVDQLLKNADAAMYSVKGSGRNGMRSYGANEKLLI
jgi:diguanylate cyclase (GGDEF)-like protein